MFILFVCKSLVGLALFVPSFGKILCSGNFDVARQASVHQMIVMSCSGPWVPGKSSKSRPNIEMSSIVEVSDDESCDQGHCGAAVALP